MFVVAGGDFLQIGFVGKMLLEAGVARVFHPGNKLEDIAAYVHEASAKVRAARFPLAANH